MRVWSCCEEKRRTTYAVTVKQLLSGSLCGQRKETCETKRRFEYREEI